jgi:hypothetical protein
MTGNRDCRGTDAIDIMELPMGASSLGYFAPDESAALKLALIPRKRFLMLDDTAPQDFTR